MDTFYRVLGIYSKNLKDHTGTGTTMQRRETKTYYYVLKSSSEDYNVQPLNMQNVPSGLFSAMSRDEFISSFTPEIDYYMIHPLPELEVLKEMLGAGAETLSETSGHAKIQTLMKALLLEPGNNQMQIDTPMAYAKLVDIVDILGNQNEEFIEEQRQEFNSAAITLRKQELYQEAINYYSKALQLNDTDQNLHFNIARAYYEIGENAEALKHIDRALEIDPILESAILFKKYILKKNKRQAP
ncbi:tetratricopeptide repeat protein [Maridesulfovibrio sp. FT414]|uniref:tetratricopeptide repeat protein n=1 Tax=Maridesulfovibrio sp. FT414 TaxID=2979469 RepID=UPI003D8010BC